MILFSDLFLLLIMCLYVSVCGYVHMSADVLRGQTGHEFLSIDTDSLC